VRAAASGQEALDALATSVPDVLISDIGLGDIDGFALLRRVRALEGPARGVPAIALTAYARAEDRASALAVGYQLHLTKPIEPRELQAAVANLVEDSRRGGTARRTG
jgi:CheY-like chemotaxis protein